MPFCRSHDLDIYYEVHGNGPPLLLVSGLGGGTWSWYAQVPFFQDFYRTITFDNRGVGRSGAPAGPYRMEQLARDALGLLDHLDLGAALVMGVSMGGMIAQEMAFLAPGRLKALVLGCTHCGRPQRVPPAPEVIEVIAANQGLSPAEIVDKDLPYLFSAGFLEEHPEEVAAYRRSQLSAPPQPLEAFRAQLEAIYAFQACEGLDRLAAPVLVVTGTADVVVLPENSGLLAGLLPRAELVELPGAGHLITVECRDRLNRLVHEFFQRQVPGRE